MGKAKLDDSSIPATGRDSREQSPFKYLEIPENNLPRSKDSISPD
jgi:hypothetical protein